MREYLGWITNCGDDHRCPMEWLTCSASELPTTLECTKCGQKVALVVSPADLEAAVAQQNLAAFPVVPCSGMKASDYVAGSADSPKAAPAPNAGRPTAPEPLAAAKAPESLFVALISGQRFPLTKDTAIIGRSRTCDVVVPSAKVSRQHASVSRAEGEFFIEDLGSANGVWRDGEKVDRAKIRDGDVFTISDETLTFTFQ